MVGQEDLQLINHTIGPAGSHSHSISSDGAHEHYEGITSPAGFEPLSGGMGRKTTMAGEHDHGGNTGAAGSHTHSVNSASNIPPYTEVVFCQKD